MSVMYAVVQGVCRNTGDGTGTTNYTSTAFGTPDAAIIVFNSSSAAENPRGHAYYSIGFLDDTNQSCCTSFDWDAVPTAATDRAHSTAICAGLSYSTTWGAKGVGSLIADGIQINWTVVPTNNYYVTIYLFKGVNNAYAGYKQLTTTGVNDITDPGFKPDIVFAATIGNPTAPENQATECMLSFGAAHNNSSDTVSQASIHFASKDGALSGEGTQALYDNSCVGQIYDGTQTWKGSAQDFDANGFSINTGGDSPANDYIFYLALELSDPDDAWVGVIDTPTSTGIQAYTGVGFTPLGLILGQTNVQAVNTIYTDDDAGGLAIGSADGTNEYSLGFASEDGNTNMYTQADANLTNVAQLYYDDGSSTSHVASLDSFFNVGFRLDFSDTDATARKWFGVAFKDPAITSRQFVSPFGIVVNENSEATYLLPTGNVFTGTIALPQVLGITTETDTAFSVTFVVPIGITVETDTAFSITAISTAVETDTALSVIVGTGTVDIAVETDSALSVTAISGVEQTVVVVINM